jgi:hypothetical protein
VDSGSFNFRDLRRGCLIGLAAGVAYLIGYRLILLLAYGSRFYEHLISLGWLLAIPLPALVLWWLPRTIRPEEPIEPREPVDEPAAPEDE